MKFSQLLLAVALVSVVACAPEEGAVIKKKGNGFELRIDGVPTFVKGVGGTNRLDVASSASANACRWRETSVSISQGESQISE